MLNLDDLKRQALELEELLRLKTYPIGVTLLEREEDIPHGFKRPVRDHGYHLALCQAISLARRQGESLALLKEDMRCFEPVLGLGMAEPPQYFLDGHNRYPETARTLEAGNTWAQSFPRLDTGKYIGITVAPLATANMIPDLFIVYPNGLQLTLLLMAKNWMDGRDIVCTVSGHGACIYAITPVVKNGQFQLAIPCLGDRRRGLASDDEVIFSGPIELLGELLAGLAHLKENGRGIPLQHLMLTDYELRDSYVKIGKMIGMDL